LCCGLGEVCGVWRVPRIFVLWGVVCVPAHGDLCNFAVAMFFWCGGSVGQAVLEYLEVGKDEVVV
jgi:hypothetical protein